jgi:hypothetical protein
LAKLSYRRKHFLVPISTLRIVGCLLQLDDLAVLFENATGEPGQEWPSDLQ